MIFNMLCLGACLLFFGLVCSSPVSDDLSKIDSSEFGGPPGPVGTTCECGKTNQNSNSRIVGGKEAPPHKYPFIARIALHNSLCGGSVLTSRHILTAAHCTIGKNASVIKVTLAEHNLIKPSPNKKNYYVEKVLQHQGFNYNNGDNDISILLLKEEIEFNEDVGRVCLPTGPLDIENKVVKVMGWGRFTNENQSISLTLQEVNLKVVSFEQCSKAWNGMIPETNPTKLCTFAKGKSACSGDSGGPIVWLDPDTNRYTQVSLNSMGKIDSIGDCANTIPRVGTRISSYLDWIKKTIDDSVPLPICTKK